MLNPLATILLLVLFSWCSKAQTPNEKIQKSSLPDTIYHVLSLSDTLITKNFSALDSIQSQAKSSFEDIKYSYDSITSVADNATSTLQHQIEKFNNINLPADKLINKLDSIAQWKDAQLRKVDEKVNSLKTNVNEKINSLDIPDELKDKASTFTAGIDKLDVTLPQTTFPEMEWSDKLPLELGGLENPLTTSVPDLRSLELDAANLGEVGDQINTYANTAGDVVPDNLNDIPSVIEEQGGKTLQLDGVQEQIGEVSELNEMAGQLNDEEYVQEQLKDQVQRHAFDHFAGKQEQLEKAMDTMSKYKKKYEDVQSVADLPKKMPNAMRGKPFVERLLPGIAIQIHRRDEWLFDFNPYIGYRISGRLTAGLGWNQRIVYNFDEGEFHNDQIIFGPRIFSEVLIAKGFSARLEGEYMKTQVPSQFSTGQTDVKGREWVFSTMAGLKKEYRFLNGINGTAMLLYNLYDPHHRSPYGDKLNVRFGFEFPMKKKSRGSVL